VGDRGVGIDLELEETAGIETVCPSGETYAWTRKQGGIRAHGTVALPGARRQLDAPAVIDDTAAYYERHTRWRWCAGVGAAVDGRALAWNLVQGVNDPPRLSERTIWIDGVATEAPPARFDDGLGGVDGLRFRGEATRERRENLLLVRSRYRPDSLLRARLSSGWARLIDWSAATGSRAIVGIGAAGYLRSRGGC